MMSDQFFDFSSFHDASTLGIALVTEDDLSIEQFLWPIPNVFEPHWFSAWTLTDLSSQYSSLGRGQIFTTRAPSEAVLVHEPTGPTGFFAPLASDIIHDVPKYFDDLMENALADQRSIESFGEVQACTLTAEDDIDANISVNSDDIDSVNGPSIIQRRLCPLPERVVSRSSSATPSDASDSMPSPGMIKVRAQASVVVLHKPKEEDKGDDDTTTTTTTTTLTSESEWEPVVNESYSWRKEKGGMKFRCNLCVAAGRRDPQICKTRGDMSRHLQSLQHMAKSVFCPNCSLGWTRQDALKRHMKRCNVSGGRP